VSELTDKLSPEDVEDTVNKELRDALRWALQGCIENWREGFWEDFEEDTTVGEVLSMFLGYIQSIAELRKEDPDIEADWDRAIFADQLQSYEFHAGEEDAPA